MVLLWRLLTLELDAGHQIAELGGGQVGGGIFADFPTVSQHVEAIGDLEQLVELVADEDDRHALALEAANHVQQLGDIPAWQRGRRFVHDQKAAILREGTGNGRRLPCADRQIAQPGAQGKVCAKLVQRFRSDPIHLAPVHPAATPGLHDVEGDVLRHGQVGEDGQVLVDDLDAERHGLRRRQPLECLPLPDDPATVRGLATGDAFHQCRLARTVGACQAQDLSGLDGHIHGIESLGADVALAQPLKT